MSSAPRLSFSSLALSDSRLQILQKLGFEAPTPIQAATIPPALEGKDIIGCAQTGTGKTAAFVLPILERINLSQGTSTLILAPTRELVLQIENQIHRLTGQHGQKVKTVAVIGGAPMGAQLRGFQEKRHIVVATPGRLVDHLKRHSFRTNTIQFLVLDEADRMLDMGFRNDLEFILKEVPKTRQTFLFSATLSNDVTTFASKFIRNPERIDLAPKNIATAKIEEKAIVVREELKLPLFNELQKKYPGPVLMFVRTRGRADQMARKLERLGHTTARIHSDRTQGQRRTALESFRNGTVRILVATDIAARGIDVSNIALVVNLDLPMTPEEYVHRIGRTGRAEHSGVAASFVTTAQKHDWQRIEKFVRHSIPLEKAPLTLVPMPQASAPQHRQEKKSGHDKGKSGHAQGRNEKFGGAQKHRFFKKKFRKRAN